jgi:isocitrate dehydrogenase kinase/phosphatase
MDLYEVMLDAIHERLNSILGEGLDNKQVWIKMKERFGKLTVGRHDSELAETFFNSVTRKIFSTRGIDREIEFFHLDNQALRSLNGPLIYSSYSGRDTKILAREILEEHTFAVGYEDVERDAEAIAREVDLILWPLIRKAKIDSIEVIQSPFFRNKVAYLVGRIHIGEDVIPIVIPLYNGEKGIYADAVLVNKVDVSIVFSFANSYFHVVVERHDSLINFLRSILPEKPLAELYIAIGYNKHGKTEFYRELHRYVHRSREQFTIAPGREGAVMIAFTLPRYEFVFKLMKDWPVFLRTAEVTNKTISKEEVMRKYRLVRHRDRAGRMVDTQEFENFRFQKKRFAEDLLHEFVVAAQQNVIFENNHVIIQHLYLQRKVTPLPMFFNQENDPEAIRKVLLDFGYFLKDMAATGVFPSDLFNIWNYGVTRRYRVVLFDYDDIAPLEQINFRVKPQPSNELEEMESEEEWIVVMPGDYFMDEIERYSGIPEPLKASFRATHADLYTVDFWRAMQRGVASGAIVDITPYDRSRKFLRT